MEKPKNPAPAEKQKPKSPSPVAATSPPSSTTHSDTPMTEAPPAATASSPQHQPQEEEEDFESFYLRKVTAEFADDIEKLRNASDFNDQSVPVLIEALKGGAAGFTEEERQIMMGKNGSEG